MSKRIDDELIDSVFRGDLNISMPALEELLILIREKPKQLDDRLQKKFFDSILSISRLPSIQIGSLTEVFRILIYHKGISSIPVERLYDSRNSAAIRILTNVISTLDKGEQEKYVPFIFKIIMDSKKIHNDDYNFLIDSLIKINGNKVKELCIKELSIYDGRILGPIRILSKIGDESICDEFIKILDNTIKGYDYGLGDTVIHTYIINYFQKVRCSKTISSLFELMSIYSGYNEFLSEISKALLNIGESILNPLLDFIEEQIKLNKMLIIQNLLISLNEIDINILNKIDIKRLLKILHPDPRKYIMYDELKNIIIKLNKKIEPILINMLKSKDDREFQFARECLEKRGKNIYEYLEENPIIELYNYFYYNMESRNKHRFETPLLDRKFPPNIGRQKNSFEHAIESLLASSGFTYIWVDPSGKKNVDIVAFSPETQEIFLIGCTIGTIKDDIELLYEVFTTVKRNFKRYKIFAIICTNISGEAISRKKDAYDKNIGLLSSNELKEIYELCRSGRPHLEILKYIKLKSIIPFFR